MSELMAKAMKARNAIPTEALAISVNLSFPQFDCQSSTRVAADEDADIRRYAKTCQSEFDKKVDFSNKLKPCSWLLAHNVHRNKNQTPEEDFLLTIG